METGCLKGSQVNGISDNLIQNLQIVMIIVVNCRQDGDTVIMRARCERDDAVPIGFGECRGTVLPAMTQ